MSGVILVKPQLAGVKQDPPLLSRLILAAGHETDAGLADRFHARHPRYSARCNQHRSRAMGEFAAQRIQI